MIPATIKELKTFTDFTPSQLIVFLIAVDLSRNMFMTSRNMFIYTDVNYLFICFVSLYIEE